ncbi:MULTISPECIES: EF-hand domain-containing protein [unclassified Roseovarius]|uniref:EF-hand domain-containing protein n=1 Tax=unclassified Roseovarius TaxID=2614913 RepID=UPI00273F7C0C|nr:MULTISPECIES: EF-hand domain-containing protein [unclassified Roseovarius]
MTKFIAILIGLGALANSAIAMGERAVEVDANGDGVMTVDEVQAVYPDITAEVFAEVDTNNDGVLDDDEMIMGLEKGLVPSPSDG